MSAECPKVATIISCPNQSAFIPAEIHALTHLCAGWVAFHPNWFKAWYGAAQAAELAGKQEKARQRSTMRNW
ncbi:MAG TPA: hypothetical protein VNY29_00065 [Terriglobales bacterium]|nr:hypothetical protein [Terriglobales bacterium]